MTLTWDDIDNWIDDMLFMYGTSWYQVWGLRVRRRDRMRGLPQLSIRAKLYRQLPGLCLRLHLESWADEYCDCVMRRHTAFVKAVEEER